MLKGLNETQGEMQEFSRLRGERVGIISLGCARNLVDSEKIIADARRFGAIVCPVEKASVVFVNTCAFIQDAKKESIGAIWKLIDLKERRKIKKIFVFGCLVERYPFELKKNFKEVDAFAGITGFKNFFDPYVRLTPFHYAYLKISEGCANNCSFCAIPLIKGVLRSRKVSEIITEAQFLESQGVVELNIIGQDISLFGTDGCNRRDVLKGRRPGAKGLVNLAKAILKNTRIPWLRLLYLHPAGVSQELLDLIASENRICPYIDLPLQHINDRILKMMNRGIDRRMIERLIVDIRRKIPDVVLRTSFIAGFPSETKKEFVELLDFIKSVKFERIGVFVYSREEGTKAYSFKNQLVEKVKRQRYDVLMSLQRGISAKLLKAYKDKMMQVLIDEERGTQGAFRYIGRSRFDAPEVDGCVFLRSKKKLSCGRIVKARITRSYAYDLEGEVIG